MVSDIAFGLIAVLILLAFPYLIPAVLAGFMFVGIVGIVGGFEWGVYSFAVAGTGFLAWFIWRLIRKPEAPPASGLIALRLREGRDE
jgi:hypothetical protein